MGSVSQTIFRALDKMAAGSGLETRLVSAGLNFHGTKLSRMAVELRKPRTFSTAKIKVHTVCGKQYNIYLTNASTGRCLHKN